MLNLLRRLLVLTVIACALTFMLVHPGLAAGGRMEAWRNGRLKDTFQPSNLPPLQPSAFITATKTYTLSTDSDGDNQADPGDVLSYTIVITNNGVTTNTGVIFSDTLDPNLNPLGLVSISPVAFDDSYNANANPIVLTIADGPTDLFGNDYPGLNPAVPGLFSFGGGSLGGTVTSNPAGSSAASVNGSVRVNANGSLVFTPAVSFQGVFSFAYRLQNFVGPGDGLVQITVDAPPTVTSTSPISGATGVNGTSNISLNFSENVAIAAGGITLGCPAAVGFTTTPALPASGINAISLDPTANLPGLTTCTVTVLAANVTDSDTLDPPNQLDGNNDGLEGDNHLFSFQVAATANDDSFAVTPHLTLNSSGTITGTVLGNDDPITVTITGFGPTPGTANANPTGSTITTTLSGRLTLNSDGTFTYNPPPDQRNTNDAFFYTITGNDTATVTLAIQNQNFIWFVDASAAPGGNGAQTRPFNLLTGAGSFDAVASDNISDTIFIADGAYTCGLTLLNNQTVVGDGSSSTLQAISGVTPVTGSSLPAFSGTDPILSNAGGDCLTLGSGNTLRGLTIGDTSATGSDITGTNFGALILDEITLNGTGRALNLLTGTLTATLDGLTSSSGTNNVNLVNVAGTANLGSGALSGASSDAFVVNGGTLAATYGGNITQNNNAALVSVLGGHNTGTLTFQTGTLNATNGTGLQFDNADGTYNFNGTNTLNGGNAGVDIINGSNGNFSFSSNSSITNPTGAAFNVNGGNGNIDYNGTISKTSDGRAIDVQNHTGGTVSFDGTVSSTSASDGINLATNTGAVINFSNTLTINTSASNTTGFNATGGGTVTATGSGSTINSGTGTALNIANTNIGASDVTFQSISSNGGSATGIILDTTGSLGGLHITGTGSAGSGGTIANKTGANGSTTTGVGIYLNNTADVQLDRMQLNGFQNFAIRASDVNGFSLQNSVINGNNGNDAGSDEGAVFIANSSGTINITSSQISGGFEDNLRVLYDSATPDTATYNITGNTFSALQAAGQNAQVNLRTTNAASTSSNVAFNIGSSSNPALGNTFDNSANELPPGGTQWWSDGILVTFGGGFQHTINIDKNTFIKLFQAIDFAVEFSADVDGRIYDNTITYTEGVGAIAFGTASTSTSSVLFQMLIEDNDIGGLGNDSGSRLGSGIVGDFRGAETARVTIHQNIVQDTEINPIRVISQMTLGQDGDTHLRITNNSATSIDDDAGGGISPVIEVLTNSSTNGDIFLTISGNTGTGINEDGIIVRQATANNTFSLEDFAGNGTIAADVDAYLEAQNPGMTARIRTVSSVVQYTTMNNNNTNTPAPLTP